MIQAAKLKPEIVLPTLAILKPFAGTLVAVEFDRAKLDVLSMVLTGERRDPLVKRAANVLDF